MAILKECTSKPSCEMELNIQLANDESIKFDISFRSGKSFPDIYTKIACLKRDFLKMLDDLKSVDNIHLKILDFHDPGLCIYHIPEYGRYEGEQRYKLIFVIDAGEKNHFRSTECGPALCIIVNMKQINGFVSELKSDIINFIN